MTDRKDSGFAKHFLWGAATAAHQVEGDNHNQWTVWELENAKAKAAAAEFHLQDYPKWDKIKDQAKHPYNYVSDNLADHYNNYEKDFEFLRKMHMNTYRFSIEWSRVEPQEGAWNVEAVTHYKQYLAELKRRDIEPVVTLMHFTLPVWFAAKGGFGHRSNAKHFVHFAERIISELGSDIRYIVIINEPEVYAHESYYLGEWPPNERSKFGTWRVLMNQAHAFKKASRAIHRLNRRYKVGVAKNMTHFYPGDSAWLSHVSARIASYFAGDYILKKFTKHSDFIGLNYYQSQRVFGYRLHNPEDQPYSDVNWMLAPGDIEYVLEDLHGKYKLPILITENWLADADDEYRQWWIKETIVAMQKAMKRGAKLIGYLHWSLMDNFEWAYGKWPRFGLVAVDYKTGQRTLRPSAIWFGGVIKKLRGL